MNKQENKRSFDILYVATERMTRTFGYEETEEKSSEVVSEEDEEDEEKQKPRRLTNYCLRRTTVCGLGNSPSLDSVESKRPRLVVSNKTVRRIREPVREREVVRERRTPEWLVNVMREENGLDAKQFFDKDLEDSDLKRGLGRLLIPFSKIIDMGCLNEEELKFIDEHLNKLRSKGVDVTLVDSRGKRWELNLRRWNMRSSSNYALATGWNNVVLHNRLKTGQKIQVWSFHSPSKLFIAFVPPDPAPSSPPAPVVTEDYEETYISQTEAQEEKDGPDRGWEGLHLLAQACEKVSLLEGGFTRAK